MKRGILLHTGCVEKYYKNLDFCIRQWEKTGALKILQRDVKTSDDIYYVIEFESPEVDEMLTTLSDNDVFCYEVHTYCLGVPALEKYFEEHNIVRRFEFLEDMFQKYQTESYAELCKYLLDSIF